MSLVSQWKHVMLIFLIFSLGLIYCCGKDSSLENSNVFIVATAASTINVVNVLADSFRNLTGIEAEIIHGSSGKLAAQITQEAPYSLFFSADEFYPDYLQQKSFGTSEKVVYAHGKLGIWIRSDNGLTQPIISLLKSDAVQTIAIAHISMAPYGKAAYDWLKNADLLPEIEHKLVFGESIAQVNTYIASGTVDVAFTSLSSLRKKGNLIEEHLRAVPEQEYTLIRQAAIMTNYGEKHFREQSLSFLKFVRSEKGQSILVKYGYSCPVN